MRSIAIHVGFHKSASTYLQSCVFPNVLANYVFLAGYRRQMLDLVQSPNQFDPEILKNWVNNKIAKVYDQKPHDLTILSHEELSGHPHGYKTVDPFVVAANLKQTFPNGKIIMIIRNQFDYLLSIYTYRVTVKGHESRSLERFLKEEGDLGLFDKLEYDKIVECYISLFGRDKVLVAPMELLKKSPEDFNRAITNFLEISPISLDRITIVNESSKLSSVIQFWRPINFLIDSFLNLWRCLHIETREEYPYMRLRYAFYSIKRKTTTLLNKLLRSSMKLHVEDYTGYDELLSRYSASDLRLQRLINFSLRGYGYPIDGDTTIRKSFHA